MEAETPKRLHAVTCFLSLLLPATGSHRHLSYGGSETHLNSAHSLKSSLARPSSAVYKEAISVVRGPGTFTVACYIVELM